MRTLWNKFGVFVKAFLWFLVGFLFVFLVSASRKAQQNILCSAVHVSMLKEKDSQFIQEKDVEKLIVSLLPEQNLHIPLKEINLNALERSLAKNPYIKNAEVYVDAKGKMMAEVQQHLPLVRVVNENNVSYYLNQDGEKMPIAEGFSARVIVASGHIVDNDLDVGEIKTEQVKNVYLLAKYINENDALKALVEQIYVEKNNDIVLTPKVGEHQIVFGSVNDIEEKFRNLLVFYKEGLSTVGWDKYKKVNLKFKNQIVCTKN